MASEKSKKAIKTPHGAVKYGRCDRSTATAYYAMSDLFYTRRRYRTTSASKDPPSFVHKRFADFEIRASYTFQL